MIDQLAAALRPALATLLRTAMVAAIATAVLAASCFLIAANGLTLRGLAAALAAVAVCLPAAAVAAWQRALGAGAIGFARRLGLVEHMVGALFAPFAGVAAVLPAAEAEATLRAAVASYTPGPEGGALRGAIERRLLATVERLTLVRFRGAGGRIDPAQVRDELAARAVDLVVGRIEGSTRTTVLLVASLAVAVAIAAAVALRALG